MDLLQRSWFKCRTCGIDCSNEVLATYQGPYDNTPTSWGECTTCALECYDCGDYVEPDTGSIGHSQHQGCDSTYCLANKSWVLTCPQCNDCPDCDHCIQCEKCFDDCSC